MNKKKAIIPKVQKLEGTIEIPGDKSISHRSVIIGSLCNNQIKVKNFLNSEDCLRTVEVFRSLGVEIIKDESELSIEGVGLFGLRCPQRELYFGNSGTAMRLMLGVLAGQKFNSILKGDKSLNSRPMDRITIPLSKMGASFSGRGKKYYAPIEVVGGRLEGITYSLPVASAQVKSAILLAGLYAKGKTTVIESYNSRDHTERMLDNFGANITVKGTKINIISSRSLEGRDIEVPGDISSAMYFILAGLIIPNSTLIIKNAGVNPTRIGAIRILREMGGDIKFVSKKDLNGEHDMEPREDIMVKSSDLHGVTITENIIPEAIDELPLLMVAGCFASGTTKIFGASELRVKETDRINSMFTNLRKLGANIEVNGDDVFIKKSELEAAKLESYKDHRTAMSLVVAAMGVNKGETVIKDIDCINTSFPQFFNVWDKLGVNYELVH